MTRHDTTHDDWQGSVTVGMFSKRVQLGWWTSSQGFMGKLTNQSTDRFVGMVDFGMHIYLEWDSCNRPRCWSCPDATLDRNRTLRGVWGLNLLSS